MSVQELHKVFIGKRVVVRVWMAIQKQLLRAMPLIIALLLLEGSVVILKLGIGNNIHYTFSLLVDDIFNFLR